MSSQLTPSGAHSFSNFSLVPRMYGVYRMIGLSSDWLFSSTFLGGCESVFLDTCSGKPLAVKTSSRSCISAGVLVSSQAWGGFAFLTSHLWGLLGGGESGRECINLYAWACHTLRWTGGHHPWIQEHPVLSNCERSDSPFLGHLKVIKSVRKKWNGIELILVEIVTEVVGLCIQIVT